MHRALQIGLAVTAIAVLTQCASVEQGAAVAATPSDGSDIPRADVAEWLGDWTGPVEQATAPPYAVNLTLIHDGDTVIGTVEYPELDCSGTLGEAELSDDVLSIVETITVGEDACITPVDLELTLRPNEIGYHFDDQGGGDGVLHRPSTI